jgi:hypothetical protein
MMIGYNGAFSIASKSDIDDQNLLLATVYFTLKVKQFVTDLAISIGSNMMNILIHTY